MIDRFFTIYEENQQKKLAKNQITKNRESQTYYRLIDLYKNFI